jgi:hypothetical protein
MKHRILQTGLVVGLLAGLEPWVQSEVLNDGRSTQQLTRLANPEETTFGSTTVLVVDAAGEYLVAEQIDTLLTPYPELRTVWYARNATATGAVYRVSAEFRPAAAEVRRQGGVMGWLDRGERRGLVFKVLPTSFQVAHVDFTAVTPEDNENLSYLYNRDGTPAEGHLESAWSPVSVGYRAEDFVRMELRFDEPTEGDVAAVTNAVVTARVTAQAWQAPGPGGVEEPLGRAIELLTTLPVPREEDHRMGYFGVWASGFFSGDVIGHFRHLEAEGAIEVSVNLPPEVGLLRPVSGAQYVEPATILMEAGASDPDGMVVQVEFFAGATSLGTVTESPFVLSWAGVAAGDYTLTAVAMDDQGDTAVSDSVTVHVLPWSGTAPTLTVEVGLDGLLWISWNEAGFQLQYKGSLSELEWTDVPGTTGVSSASLPIESGARYFRLVGSGGPPPGPALSVERSGADLVITWPAGYEGYRLESAETLMSAQWEEVETTGNAHVEPVVGVARFYRLRQP